MSDGGDGGGGGDGDWGGGGGDEFYDNNDHHSHHHHYNDNYYHDNHHYGYGNEANNKKEIPKCILNICALILLVLSVGFIAGGITTTVDTNAKLDEWLYTNGTIIDRIYCGDRTYRAVIEYTVKNETYVIYPSSCSQPGPKVGNGIKVLYDPENPGEAVDGSFIGLWLLPILLFSFFACTTCGWISTCWISCTRKDADSNTTPYPTSDITHTQNNELPAFTTTYPSQGNDHHQQQQQTQYVENTPPPTVPSTTTTTTAPNSSSAGNTGNTTTGTNTGTSLFDQMNSNLRSK
mmetsp:Transcript_7278/g.9253  ORF Transcript_7278/g.9253 Transcript_7278/m.9253 type:complete len:291 (+) Transcript_7278:314-1186(+)